MFRNRLLLKQCIRSNRPGFIDASKRQFCSVARPFRFNGVLRHKKGSQTNESLFHATLNCEVWTIRVSDFDHILSLKPFVSLDYIELDFLGLHQGF